MASRTVNTSKPSAIQMYDYKDKVFKNKALKPVPSLSILQQQQQQYSTGSNEDAPSRSGITRSTGASTAPPAAVDVEQGCPATTGGAKHHHGILPWYRCPPLGIDHPCFVLGLLIAAAVTVFLLYRLILVFINSL